MTVNEDTLKNILNMLSKDTEESNSNSVTNLDKLAREQAKSVQERRETIKKIRQEKYHK
ncbi:hypothetical protein [Enterococcus faecium]|uniref:hypothetical protein n=1 Tax=Enterococcus faecium TaxID=1352 RepID=UPI00187CE7EA|nr:hypothetical protein [Enterococcus faecium]